MAPHSPASQQQTTSAVQHLSANAQLAPLLQQWAATPIRDRDSQRDADDIERQAWREYITDLPPGTQPRFCKDCSHNSLLDAECRAVISEVDAVLGPRRAKCRDVRKSDGPCGFAAVLFDRSTNLPG